jgi:hypothetical protein
MSKVIEASELPEGEKVFLKHSFDGWRVVYPFKNEDGTINWFNLCTGGSWWSILKTLFLLFIILGVSWSYAHDTKQCRELVNNPCDYYVKITEFCTDQDTNNPLSGLNLSGFEEVNIYEWGG